MAAVKAQFTPGVDVHMVSHVGGRFAVGVELHMTIPTGIQDYSRLTPAVTIREAVEQVFHMASGTVPGTVPKVVPGISVRVHSIIDKTLPFNVLYMNRADRPRPRSDRSGCIALWQGRTDGEFRSPQPASA